MSYKKLEYRVHDDGNISYHNEDGKLHRPNGPAIEFADGRKEWFFNGLRHREDGPAIEFADGRKEWYLNNKEITEREWKIATSPPTEMTAEEISKALGHRVKVVE